MAFQRTVKFLPVALLLLRAAAAEAAPGSPAIQLSPVFRELARASKYIFIGTVISVRESPRGSNAIPTVEVTFRVEKSLRGVRTGQPFKIREWAGLWESAQQYRPGERLLVFLYPESKLGLTSIAGEPPGRIRADSGGRFLLSSAQYAAWFHHGRSESVLAPRTPRLTQRQLSNAVLRAFREPK